MLAKLQWKRAEGKQFEADIENGEEMITYANGEYETGKVYKYAGAYHCEAMYNTLNYITHYAILTPPE